MLEVIFLSVLALGAIGFASIQDIKRRETANWLSFALIIFAIGFRFFYSLFSDSAGGFGFFYQGLIGLGIFYVLGNLFYFGRIFAGGDAKLMIALGPVLPFSYGFFENLNLFANFFLIFLICGSLYGIVYSIVLAIKHFHSFKKEFSTLFSRFKKVFYLCIILAIGFMSAGYFWGIFTLVAIFIFVTPYLYIYAVSVEKTCLIIETPTSKLVEGDWLYGDVKIGNKVLKANWDGLNAKEIAYLKKKKKYVMIRNGIAFIPVFLIALLLFILNYFFIGINVFGLF